MDRTEQMNELRDRARCLTGTKVGGPREPVWGEGDVRAVMVIVGEAPGRYEESSGRPFVGPAGQLLEDALASAGASRSEIYLTNVVKQRPAEAGKNRSPNVREIALWLPILKREIEIIAPRVIVCLGRVAASALIRSGFDLESGRGMWSEDSTGRRLLATYHPAYVRRFGRARILELFQQDIAEAVRHAKQ